MLWHPTKRELLKRSLLAAPALILPRRLATAHGQFFGGMVYPFPNALNTGVPGYPNATTGANAAAKAALTAYSGANPITVDGTVISGKSFTRAR